MNETSQNGKDRELLTIRHMRKAFGDNQVLKDISLSDRNGARPNCSSSRSASCLACSRFCLSTRTGASMTFFSTE